MNPFLPSFGQVNRHWVQAWGESLGDTELAEKLVSNRRLADRAFNRMLNSFDMDLRATFPQDQIIAATAYAEDREKLVQLCGLTLQGKLLKSQVTKSDFDLIRKLFSIEDLRIAVSLSEFHQTETSFGSDIARLPELVARSGRACVGAWKSALSEQMSMRIQLMDDPNNTDEIIGQSVPVGSACNLVEAVSHHMISQSASSARAA
ncbi:MAG: hypothetical protein AAF217_00870 [Pseudomonadota bacterium]